MAIFPAQFFVRDNVRVRSREDYTSRPLVEKSLGHPKGVYLGFIPTAGATDVTLAVDPVRSVSVVKLHSDSDPGGMDIVYTDPVVLDFSGALPSEFPAYIVATATYDRAGLTSAQISARVVPITTGELLYTVGGSAEVVDLASFTIANTPIRPSTLEINVTNSIVGPVVITDDGRGNLVGPDGLSAPGTVNYRTGALTGTTAALAAASTITANYEEGISPYDALICIVDGPLGSLSIRATEPHERTTPIARAAVPYGFMPAGSMEVLDAVIDNVNEVVAARTDLSGTAWASLSERLAADAGATLMAGRIAPALRLLRSNDHAGAEGDFEVVVGGSLSEVNRTHLPRITLPGGGSETQLGSVTAAPRNLCVVVDATTGSRLIDSTTRALVYGRLQGPEVRQLTGTVTFTQASNAIVGVGSSFRASVLAGDLLVAPDGLLYEVEQVTSDISITLVDSYLGSTATVDAPTRQRYTLRLVFWDEDEETNYSLEADTLIRFFFPVFLDQSASAFDATMFMNTPGDKPALPAATTAIAGHNQLAAVGGTLGSIDVQEAGVFIGKFRSIDFADASGGINETADGVITVTNIGPKGPTGPTGVVGGTGPEGPQGESFTAFSLSQFDTEVSLDNPPGGATVTHTVDMGHEVRAAYGWFARARAIGQFTTADEIEISNITASGTSATVECSVTATTRVRLTLYLSSAGIA